MRGWLIAVVAVMASSSASGGVVYSATTRSQTGQAVAVTRVRGYIQGPNAKLEFLQESSVAPGTYVLTRDAGKTFVQVNPEARTYAQWESPQNAGGAGEKVAAQTAKTSIRDVKFEKLLDEDGGMVLGMPTRHVRYRTAYSFTIRLMREHTTHMISEDELWITQKISDPGLKHWFQGEGAEQSDELIRTELSKINGVPLKRVTALTSIEEDGESETTRTEMNVTEIVEKPLPASTFVVPAGYRRQAAPQQPAEADPQ